ncbi:hypothetical protein [Congzhengia minquanensis]|uniref:Uncharacterized protein n=1 Tax=Congzhengia minquanensis TaxID=2763657 RepID=A0A926DKY4_9FIRM|nr:hypothetical protein [Congzhengia minquanensis]MBC8540850.1 hypothetical protein [Congzhengia minquanensis]
MYKEVKIIGKSIGKIFENNFKASIPDNIWYYRPPDSAQGFDIGASSKLRFSQHSPCDCMLFNGTHLFCLELKTVFGTSISFEREKDDKGVIHKYQFDSLSKFAKYKNVISGFLLDFRKSDHTYFTKIDDVLNMIKCIDKKSFNEGDLLKHSSPTLIEKKKLKVNYKYNVALMIEQVIKKGD